ncbi:SIA4A sialyltransferase, partial [Polyodon spathula]|nr:SIA4A sialyltransferase [Polyodon spathula]
MLRMMQRKQKVLTLLCIVLTLTTVVLRYSYHESSSMYYLNILHGWSDRALSNKPCACEHCVSEAHTSPWFDERFNHSIRPLMSENTVLSEDTYIWWQMLQHVKDPANLTAVMKELFKIIPSKEMYLDWGAPRCRKCAVVGNSGNLKGSSYGSQIDLNDFVFRIAALGLVDKEQETDSEDSDGLEDWDPRQENEEDEEVEDLDELEDFALAPEEVQKQKEGTRGDYMSSIAENVKSKRRNTERTEPKGRVNFAGNNCGSQTCSFPDPVYEPNSERGYCSKVPKSYRTECITEADRRYWTECPTTEQHRTKCTTTDSVPPPSITLTEPCLARMNQAPTAGHEKDVGRRTTHHLMYPESAKHLQPSTSLVLIPFKILDLQWLVSALTTGNITQTYTQVLSTITASKDKILIFNPTFFKYISNNWLENRGRYPSTGLLTLVFAIHICDEVNVYGFGANSEGKWHHYWEDIEGGAFRQTGVHDGDYEYNITRILADIGKINFFKGR